MNLADQIRKFCAGCRYAREDGCLNPQERRGTYIRGWDCGVTVKETDEGTIFYYQDIDACTRWKIK